MAGSKTGPDKKPLAERFWSKVDKNGPIVREGLGACWVWTATTAGGYGVLGDWRNGKTHSLRSHRVSWELHNSTIPDDLWVLHKCDNRRCVNPDHLFLGTALDNNRDCVRKGRNFHGPAKSEVMRRVAKRGNENGARKYPERVRAGIRAFHAANPGVYRGRKSVTTKLDEQKVLGILIALRDRAATRTQLAEMHGVSVGLIDMIRMRKRWMHVQIPAPPDAGT